MRKKLVAGNWKMNLSQSEAVSLCKDLRKAVSEADLKAEVLVFPPYLYLQEARNVLEGTSIGVGAQDCSAHPNGAFTGEVSAAMIQSLNLHHVIIGHSERRQYHKETDALLLAKLKQALSADLTPVFCIGEPLEIRDKGTHLETVADQLRNTLFALSKTEAASIILAYEPVWAIGTGRNASVEQAQEMHEHLRKTVSNEWGEEFAQNLRILYGGSCKPSNARELFACKDVDGGLIGGASLLASDFLAIIRSV